MTFLEEQIGPWKPVGRAAAIGWLVFYIIFFLYAAFNHSGFLFLDYVNLIIHEGGFSSAGSVPRSPFLAERSVN